MPKVAKAKGKKSTRRAARAEPAPVRMARALDALAVVDRKDAAATALVLSEALAAIANQLDSDALGENERRTLARRVRAARLKVLGRRTKRRAHVQPTASLVKTQVMPVQTIPIVVVDEAPSPPSDVEPESAIPPTVASDPSWLPKTLHMAGVVEGHEPTAVVLGLLREALTSATTKRAPTDDEAPPVRPLPVVLADLFGAFGLSRAAPQSDDSTDR